MYNIISYCLRIWMEDIVLNKYDNLSHLPVHHSPDKTRRLSSKTQGRF